MDYPSGAWNKFSPTGIELGEEYCKSFDHSDGKPWYFTVYNSVTHYPPDPVKGAYYPSNKDKPRFIERHPRSMVFVLRIAPMRRHVLNTNPNERALPTEHKADKNRFEGTLLSALDLVWCTEDKLDIEYKTWCNSNGMDDLVIPEHGEHTYICDIVGSYYAKLDGSATKKYAILYPYRPMLSKDGEPEIKVLELDQDEKFVDGAVPKSVKGERIIEIGGGTNSLCNNVVDWLKKNMGQYYNDIQVESGTIDGQIDPSRASEKMLGILDEDELQKSFQMCSRTLATTLMQDDVLMGVRKGRTEWFEIKQPETKNAPPEVEKRFTGIWVETTEYDRWFNLNLLKSVEIVETVCEFAIIKAQAPVLLAKMLTQHEEDILKHLLQEVDWQKPHAAQAYSMFDDPYHKLDAEGKIRLPVYEPFVYSMVFLETVTITTARDPIKVFFTEHTVWTSRYSREFVHKALEAMEKKKQKPQWLIEEIALRDKAMSEEEKKQRKAAYRSSGKRAPGDPGDGDDDDDDLDRNMPKRSRRRTSGTRTTASPAKSLRGATSTTRT